MCKYVSLAVHTISTISSIASISAITAIAAAVSETIRVARAAAVSQTTIVTKAIAAIAKAGHTTLLSLLGFFRAHGGNDEGSYNLLTKIVKFRQVIKMLTMLRASEGTLSCWSRLHLQSLAYTNPYWVYYKKL
jgi:hypothetical protein